ncbi:hypothetical protein BC826DRAFT_975325 [Russula brevipes]|nr:hypothetical protein BC826DRAFT_975325 [Russula brevipes]
MPALLSLLLSLTSSSLTLTRFYLPITFRLGSWAVLARDCTKKTVLAYLSPWWDFPNFLSRFPLVTGVAHGRRVREQEWEFADAGVLAKGGAVEDQTLDCLQSNKLSYVAIQLGESTLPLLHPPALAPQLAAAHLLTTVVPPAIFPPCTSASAVACTPMAIAGMRTVLSDGYGHPFDDHVTGTAHPSTVRPVKLAAGQREWDSHYKLQKVIGLSDKLGRGVPRARRQGGRAGGECWVVRQTGVGRAACEGDKARDDVTGHAGRLVMLRGRVGGWVGSVGLSDKLGWGVPCARETRRETT